MSSDAFEDRISQIHELMRSRRERNQRVRLAAINRDWNEFDRLAREIVIHAGGGDGGEDTLSPGTDSVGVHETGN